MPRDSGASRQAPFKDMTGEVSRRHGEMHWVSRIRDALDMDRFTLFYQPIMMLSDDDDSGGNTDALCRAIMDGPNEYLGQLATVILALICAAKRRVAIMTPYFLPSQDLQMALRAAISDASAD